MLTVNSSSKQLTCFVSIWFNYHTYIKYQSMLYEILIQLYDIMLRCWQDDPGTRPTLLFGLRNQLKAMATLHRVKFLHSVISCGVIKYVELFKIKVIEVIMINSATKCLCSPSSWLISQLSTTEDLLNCQVFEHFR